MLIIEVDCISSELTINTVIAIRECYHFGVEDDILSYFSRSCVARISMFGETESIANDTVLVTFCVEDKIEYLVGLLVYAISIHGGISHTLAEDSNVWATIIADFNVNLCALPIVFCFCPYYVSVSEMLQRFDTSRAFDRLWNLS